MLRYRHNATEPPKAAPAPADQFEPGDDRDYRCRTLPVRRVQPIQTAKCRFRNVMKTPKAKPESGKAAALGIVAHPDWSDRRIAEAVGCGVMTVGRMRKSGVPNGTPEKRTGRDGKKQSATKHKTAPRDTEPEPWVLIATRRL